LRNIETSAFPWPQAYAQHLDIPGKSAHDNAKRIKLTVCVQDHVQSDRTIFFFGGVKA